MIGRWFTRGRFKALVKDEIFLRTGEMYYTGTVWIPIPGRITKVIPVLTLWGPTGDNHNTDLDLFRRISGVDAELLWAEIGE